MYSDRSNLIIKDNKYSFIPVNTIMNEMESVITEEIDTGFQNDINITLYILLELGSPQKNTYSNLLFTNESP